MIRRWKRSGAASTLLIALGVGLAAAVLASGVTIIGRPDSAVHPLALAVLLAVMALPIVRWAVGGDRRLFRIVAGAMGAKVVATAARYLLTADAGDATAYSRKGSQIAAWLSEGMVFPNEPRVSFGGHGTTNLSYAIGWFFHVTGVRTVTAFVMFSFLSYVGSLLIYRAATTAVPEVDRTRLALLLFYLPSLLFWPSSLGKDAWMLGALGLTTLGVAALMTHRYSPTAIGSLVVGLLAAGWIRPHVAALATVALVAALLWPKKIGRNMAQQVIGLVVAFVILVIALDQVADFFGSERFEVAEVLDRAESVTAADDSEFEPSRVTGPLSFVPALVTVLFRPFPHEAASFLQLISSMESVALLALAIGSRRRLRTVPRLFAKNGFIRFSLIYLLGFVVAFSVISNFGILARQRSQLWPFVLVLLSLRPAPIRASRWRRAEHPAVSEATSRRPRSTSTASSSRSRD